MMADAPKTTLLDRVRAMAAEIGLEGDDLEKYVNQHMEKAGWVRNTNWSPPDGKPGEGDKSPGWF
jgi:hypothetical protein